MSTGRRRTAFVLFQTYTTVAGPYNDVKTWVEHSQRWVEITPKRGGEKFTAGEVESVVTHVVRGDYFDLLDVTPQMRMVFDPETMDYDSASPPIASSSRVYQILAVIPDDMKNEDVMLQIEEEGRNYGEFG